MPELTLAALSVEEIPAVPFVVAAVEVADALPSGAILAVAERTGAHDDVSVWRVVSRGTAELLSHHTSETEALDWFLRDNGRIVVWAYPHL